MKLLHIDSSITGANSVSRKLSAAIVARQKALRPGLEEKYLDLIATPPAHLSPVHLGAWFGHAPTDPAVIADIAATSSYIDDLFAADIIVIGAPMYNFGISSYLKAWIDRVLVAGKTFKYSETGTAVSLLPPGKKVYIASSRGGLYTPGNPAAPYEHQESHLLAALGFIGLTDVSIIRAEGVAMPDLKVTAVEKALAEAAALS
jgi:FMN-dependent NADH-azoreductase